MKHLLKILALASCLAVVSPGCVQENGAVRLNGVYDLTDDSCKSADEPDVYMSRLFYDSGMLDEYNGFFNFSNDMPEDSPWASGGSSSASGSTLDSTVISRNIIFIDKFYYECVSIDDDEDNCEDIDVVEVNAANLSIKAQGTARLPFTLSKDILWDFKKKTQIRIWAHYHDEGVLSGSNYVTNKIIIDLVDVAPDSDDGRNDPSYKYFNLYTCKDDPTAPSEDCSIKYQDWKDWECDEDSSDDSGGDTGAGEGGGDSGEGGGGDSGV